MVNIAICDDDFIQRETIIKFLNVCCQIREWDFQLYVFSSGEDLLNTFETSKYDIIFLDIYMKKLTGIDTAKIIRQSDSNVNLVFVTITPEFCLNGFEVGALHYILKPVTEESINDVLIRCEKQISKFGKYITIQDFNISIRNILFVEVFNKQCIIHTINRNITVSSSITNIVSEIADDNFVRCHRSYYVNLYHADVISNDNNIIMKNGDKIPISIRRKNEVISMMDKILFERVWLE